MDIEEIEAELAEKCRWCWQGRWFGREWCRKCGGSGLARTHHPKGYQYSGTQLSEPAPYLNAPIYWGGIDGHTRVD